MEANIVVKAEDLTPDFADGIRKIFSSNAILHIKVEYDIDQKTSSTPGKRRGPKPKNASKPEEPRQKRAYKKRQPIVEGPKKRGPKPKVAAE